MLTCKSHRGNGICENVGRPASDWFCEEICQGRKEIWSKWLESIQSKISPAAKQIIEQQKAEQAKAMAELPSWFQQAKNLYKHAKQILDYWNQTGRILVSPEQKAERLAICDDCEKLLVQPKTGSKRCAGCGCHLAEIAGIEKGKADYEALTCEHWPKIQP